MDGAEINGENIAMATDGATVGQVIGHQSNNNTNTFNIDSKTPQQKFAAAIGRFHQHASRKATELIESAMAEGDLRSGKVAYYWQLTLLADRPFDHLTPIEQQKIIEAHRLARSCEPDGWTDATEVVVEFLHCYTSRFSKEGFDENRYDLAMTKFEALPEVRREELVLHISSLMEGVKGDRLAREQEHQIKQHRMGDERRRRVPLFFDPDPASPQPRRPARLDVPIRAWAALVMATASCGWAFYLLGAGALREQVWSGVILVVWALASTGCLGVWGTRYVGELRQQRRYRARVTAARAAPRTDLHEVIARRFASAGSSEADLSVEQDLLAQTLSELYPVPTAPDLEWLIRWHAEQATNGAARQGFPRVTHRERALGAGVSTVLALSLEAVQIAQWTWAACLTLLGAGALMGIGGVCLRSGITVFTASVIHEAEKQRNEHLFEQEQAAWWAETRRLEDRPPDSLMARWLDYDTLHIRLSAMKQWGLGSGDVLADVVLTEPTPRSRTARETGCPRRYAQYVIRLFLLTRNGVRQLDVTIDFASGAENDQERRAFKYNAIASAFIVEPTTRKHGRRQVATVDGGGPSGQVRPIRRQSLKLTLVNREQFEVNADYDASLPEENVLDPEALAALEMETSGAVSTLRTLETVAGEGREWIARETERLRVAAQAYQRAGAQADV